MAVRAGKLVCGAFYGHPGLCADAPHDAVEQARAEGYEALMLPAVSSIDCLWADLGIEARPRSPSSPRAG